MRTLPGLIRTPDQGVLIRGRMKVERRDGDRGGYQDVFPYIFYIYFSLIFWWSCVLNCIMLLSLPCFYAFADLPSLHLIAFVMFVILVSILN